MKFTKTLALISAAALLTCCFTGCGKDEEKQNSVIMYDNSSSDDKNSDADTSSAANDNSTGENGESFRQAAIGESLTTDDVSISVLSCTEFATHNEDAVHPYDCSYIGVKISVTNNSDKEYDYNLNTKNQVIINDEDFGVLLDAMILLETDKIADYCEMPKTISPGETAEGYILFVIPQWWEKFTFNTTAFRDNEAPEYISYDITKESLS